MTELILWPLLQTNSRRALVRKAKKYGHPYTYRPRGDLVTRLMEETGMTYEEVFNQLQKERVEMMREYT
ncbi:hypothetical protein H6F67_14065 [Microcoleus sp. FACHB-1515]|uniref:hypothetical protein n=1 Tax=Cyanophyceae TaxID=3028117 RepID=UPI001689DA2D|nr:hypothetical protein [Microcoleus sp. FACHB-1515]MBD2090977.1 hypothetical protein [Microcoleus sp. FACHB-1515]